MVPSDFEKDVDTFAPQAGVENFESKLTEIDIDSIEGQKQFLEALQDAYAEAMDYEQFALADRYQKLDTPSQAGSQVFDQLSEDLSRAKEIVKNCCEVLIPAGEMIPDESFEELQALYNQMLSVRNLLIAAYGADYERVSKAEKECATSDFSPADSADVAPDYKAVLEEVQSIEKVEAQLEVVRHAADVVTKSSQAIGSDIKDSFKDRELSSDIKVGLAELAESMSRIGQINKDLSEFVISTDDLLASEDALCKLSQSIAEAEKNMESIENYLNSKITLESKSAEATAVVPEEVAQPEERRLPTELEVSTLMKVLYGNQFYSEDERKQVLDLKNSYDSALKNGMTEEEIVSRYESLKTAIEVLKNAPKVKDIQRRAALIVEKISFGSDRKTNLPELAEDLLSKIDSLATATSLNERKLFETYQKLERLAFSNESQWQMICGLPIPEAGPGGVAAAHKLRERLMVERDKHPLFRQFPEKKVLLDKLVRRLANVPKSGLSRGQDLPEIFHLARAIDVMESVDGEQAKDVFVTEVENEGEDVWGISGSHRHAEMSISFDDGEGDVAITVAGKAEDYIHHSPFVTPIDDFIPEIESTTPSMVVPEDIPEAEKSALGVVEAKDSINNVVPRVQSRRESKVSSDKNSLVVKYLAEERYQSFIVEHFESVSAFERALQTLVAEKDAKAVDYFERVLGDVKASTFDFLRLKTVGEIEELASLPHKEIKAVLGVENIKYESFLDWMDFLGELRQDFDVDENMVFEEFFARGVIEAEMYFAAEASGA